MSYLGRVTNKSSDIRVFDVTSSTSATHTLTWTAPNEQSLIVTINGVKQHEDAYSVSGTTLTLTDALVATDKLEVIGINDLGTTITPAQNSITNDMVSSTAAISQSKLATLAIDTAEIADDAVTADKLANSINTEIAANTAKVTNATHTGDVTGATALTIAADAVDIAMLSATGTADATTFLRGDNAWASAGGDNTPAFMAYMTSGMTPSSNTWTKVTCATEVFDSDSAYDNSTNYRFTVPAGEGGKYYVYGSITMYTGGYAQMVEAVASIYLNGAQSATTLSSYFAPTTNYGYGETPAVHGVMDLSASDYIELWGSCATSSGSPTFAGTTSYVRTYFGAHKLIGV